MTGNKWRETGTRFLQDPNFPGQGDLTVSAATGGRLCPRDPSHSPATHGVTFHGWYYSLRFPAETQMLSRVTWLAQGPVTSDGKNRARLAPNPVTCSHPGERAALFSPRLQPGGPGRGTFRRALCHHSEQGWEGEGSLSLRRNGRDKMFCVDFCQGLLPLWTRALYVAFETALCVPESTIM